MKITLTITARTTDADGTETSTQTVQGFLHRDDTSVELRYREPTGEDALGNTFTQLRVFDNRLELQRTGDYRCLMILEPGATHDCPYQTPFGVLSLSVTTYTFHAAIDETGRGELSVCYAIGTDPTSDKHELRLQVQPFQ